MNRIQLGWMVALLVMTVPVSAQGVVKPGNPAVTNSRPIRTSQLEAALQDLLQRGIPDKGRADLSEAKRHFDDAQVLAPENPDSFLVYGLVLLHNQQKREGLRNLDLARKAKGKLLPTAYRVAMLYTVNDPKSKFATIADDAQAFGEALQAAPDSALSEKERKDATKWLGRFIGYYLYPGEKIEAAQCIRDRQVKLVEVFAPELREVFQQGIDDVRKEYELLQKSVEADSQQLGDQAHRQRNAKLDKIFEAKEFELDAQQKLKMNREQWAKWYKEKDESIQINLGPKCELLDKLLTEYNRKRQFRSLGGIDLEVAAALDADLAVLGPAILRLKEDVEKLTLAKLQVDAIAREAGLAIVNRDLEIQAKQSKLSKSKTRTEKKELPAETARRNKQLRVDDFSTYLRIDLRGERNALLKELRHDESQ